MYIKVIKGIERDLYLLEERGDCIVKNPHFPKKEETPFWNSSREG